MRVKLKHVMWRELNDGDLRKSKNEKLRIEKLLKHYEVTCVDKSGLLNQF